MQNEANDVSELFALNEHDSFKSATEHCASLAVCCCSAPMKASGKKNCDSFTEEPIVFLETRKKIIKVSGNYPRELHEIFLDELTLYDCFGSLQDDRRRSLATYALLSGLPRVVAIGLEHILEEDLHSSFCMVGKFSPHR